MLELQRQVKNLKEQLESTQHQVEMRRVMTYWEKAARRQLHQKRKVLEENEQLREATNENHEFTASLKTFLMKKRRSEGESTVDEWQQYKLAATACLRAAGIHAIADRQYERLDTALINAGLWGPKENHFCIRPMIQNGGETLFIELARRIRLDAPRAVVGKAVWSIYSVPEMQVPVYRCSAGTSPSVSSVSNFAQSIEMLDPCTVYEMLEEKAYDGVICHSNLIRKSYEEEDRHVILSRTVLRDALAPQMVQGDVEDESTWIVVESDEENPHQCFFTFLYDSQTDLSEISRPKPSNKENFITKVAMLKAQGQELVPTGVYGMKFEDLPPSMAIWQLKRHHMDKAVEVMAGLEGFGEWNIEQDLHFLIATDKQLEIELDYVCDLLIDSSSDSVGQETDTSSPTQQQPNRPPKRKGTTTKPTAQARQKQEMLELQRQVKVLKAQLEATIHQTAMQRDMSGWEKAARTQLYQKQKAIQENEQLRKATAVNTFFIEKMQSLLRKKPRLAAETSAEEWQEYKLAARASLRAAGIHAIADRQFNRLDTTLINAGLWGLKENLFRVVPKTMRGSKTYMLEVIHHAKLNAPKEVIGNAAWAVFNDPRFQFPIPEGARRVIEMVDLNTMYEMYEEQGADGVVCHSNVVRKLYKGEDRQVIVSRTVLEDALAPQMVHGDVEDESSWIVVEADEEDHLQCYFTFFIQVKTELSEITISKEFDGDFLVELLDKLVLKAMPNGQGLIPTEVNGIDWNKFPPSVAMFTQNGKNFEKHLILVLNQAIASYHASVHRAA
ncbi:unnamed protein product [Aphanomyces euteiches]